MKQGFLTVAVATPKISLACCSTNQQNHIWRIREAAVQGVKLLVLPELGLTGYTCGDLFLQPLLLQQAAEALRQLLEQTQSLDIVFLVGLPVRQDGLVYNCAAVCHRGKLLGLVPKTCLPAYGEYSESRWFSPAPKEPKTVHFCGQDTLFGQGILFRCRQMPELVIGVEICEDLWMPQPPSTQLAAAGATVICNLSASSEAVGKSRYRRELVRSQSARLYAAYLYASSGNGESTADSVYSGHDLIAENGTLLAEQRFSFDILKTELDLQRLEQERRRTQAYACMEAPAAVSVWFDLLPEVTKLTRPIAPMPFVPEHPIDLYATCEECLTLAARGLQHRMEHTYSKTAVLGLSGGLDSTLALLITLRAFDLMKKSHHELIAVTMPCFGTTDRTRSNAEILAKETGCSFMTIPIGDTVRSHFRDIGQSMDKHDVTFENGQARERTQVLMDLANMCGGLVIGTGDMSELALGWATYNGDHMSMYGVNASIPKTLVRHLVSHAADQEQKKAVQAVLWDILNTPVSPELLPAKDGQIAQITEDLVGPYELHDFFLYYFLRWAYSPAKIFRLACYAFDGKYEKDVILKWMKTFYKRFFTQQFKRSCLPEGPKVGSLSLSPRGDWKMPSDALVGIWLEELNQIIL